MDKSLISVVDSRGLLLPDQDFISNNNLKFYYDPVCTNRQMHYQHSMRQFEILRRSLLDYDQTVCVSNIAKLPYLYRDIGNSKRFDFPVCVRDDTISCGAGRIVVSGLLYPRLRLDSILQTSHQRLDLAIIRDLKDFVDLLDYRNHGYTQGSHYHILVGNDGLIYATDRSDVISNRFPFIQQTLSDRMTRYIDYFIRTVKWLPLCDIDIQYIEEWVADLCIFGTEIIDQS